MSRTRKGSKSPGYEYWSRRPGNKNGGLLGKEQKKMTHRLERIQGKKQCTEDLECCPICNELAELDGNHYCSYCDAYMCECDCGEKCD